MGIIGRFADIIKANVNDLIDKCEDPAKMIDQTLRDLAEDLAEVKKETAAIMAEEARAKRMVDEIQDKMNKYDAAARQALLAGNEADATKLLQSKQEVEGRLATAMSTYNVAKANADKMKQMYAKITNDINTLNAKRENIKAQVAMAKAQERINNMSAVSSAQAATDKFARMEAKAQKMLDNATAEAQLNMETANAGNADLLDKYANGGDTNVNAELERMKREMGLMPAPAPAPSTPDPVAVGVAAGVAAGMAVANAGADDDMVEKYLRGEA